MNANIGSLGIGIGSASRIREAEAQTVFTEQTEEKDFRSSQVLSREKQKQPTKSDPQNDRGNSSCLSVIERNLVKVDT